jgi:hypothetical protein
VKWQNAYVIPLSKIKKFLVNVLEFLLKKSFLFFYFADAEA